jgi:hypothetical protein
VWLLGISINWKGEEGPKRHYKNIFRGVICRGSTNTLKRWRKPAYNKPAQKATKLAIDGSLVAKDWGGQQTIFKDAFTLSKEELFNSAWRFALRESITQTIGNNVEADNNRAQTLS